MAAIAVLSADSEQTQLLGRLSAQDTRLPPTPPMPHGFGAPCVLPYRADDNACMKALLTLIPMREQLCGGETQVKAERAIMRGLQVNVLEVVVPSFLARPPVHASVPPLFFSKVHDVDRRLQAQARARAEAQARAVHRAQLADAAAQRAIQNGGASSSSSSSFSSYTPKYRANSYYKGIALVRGVLESGNDVVITMRFRPHLLLQLPDGFVEQDPRLQALTAAVAKAADVRDDQVLVTLERRPLAQLARVNPDDPTKPYLAVVANFQVPNRDAHQSAVRFFRRLDSLGAAPWTWKTVKLWSLPRIAGRPHTIRVKLHEGIVKVEQQVLEQLGARPQGWITLERGYRFVPKAARLARSATHEIELLGTAVTSPLERARLAPHATVSYDGEMVSHAGNTVMCNAARLHDCITNIGMLFTLSFTMPGALAELGHKAGETMYRVMLTTMDHGTCPGGVVVVCRSEAEMLGLFVRLMTDVMRADIVTGWNILGFDAAYLWGRYRTLGGARRVPHFPFRHWVSCLPTDDVVTKGMSATDDATLLWGARAVFDGLPWDMQRPRMFGAQLDNVAKETLGEEAGKHPIKYWHMNLVHARREPTNMFPELADKGGGGRAVVRGVVNATESGRMPFDLCPLPEEVAADPATPATRGDAAAITAYCWQDCELVLQVLMVLGYLQQVAQQCFATCTPFSILSISGQQAKLVNCLVRFAHDKLRMVVNGLGDDTYASFIKYMGGTVLKPVAGLYGLTPDMLRNYRAGVACLMECLMTLDFASLYPSIMRQFNLCPSTLVHPGDVARLREAGVPVNGHVANLDPDGKPYGELVYFIMYIPERRALAADQAAIIVGLRPEKRLMKDDRGVLMYTRRVMTEITTASTGETRMEPGMYTLGEGETAKYWQYNDLGPTVKTRGRQGFLPRILGDLLQLRKAAKAKKKAAAKAGNKEEAAMWDCVQLAIKVVMVRGGGGFARVCGKCAHTCPCARPRTPSTASWALGTTTTAWPWASGRACTCPRWCACTAGTTCARRWPSWRTRSSGSSSRSFTATRTASWCGSGGRTSWRACAWGSGWRKRSRRSSATSW